MRRLDFPLLLGQWALMLIGLGLVASAGGWSLARKQMAFAGVGLFLQALASRLDYRTLGQRHKLLYLLGIGSLLAVGAAGAASKGAQRWISLGPVGFQPSEPMKLCLILTLSAWLGAWRAPGVRAEFPFWTTLGVTALPALLVLRQPDLGTALVLVALLLLQLYAAGASLERLLGLVVVGGSLLPIVLHRYQLERLLIFLNPQKDPLGAGWNLLQAELAVGSGGWLGYGWGQGPLTHYGLVPEQHTDFIFTVAGEELGLLGCFGILALYALLIGRGLWIARCARDSLGSLLVIGVVGMIAVHAVVNTGMVLGLLPVTGVPLPLLSYGGSSLWTTCVGLGIVQSVWGRRRQEEDGGGLDPDPAFWNDPDRRRVWRVA